MLIVALACSQTTQEEPTIPVETLKPTPSALSREISAIFGPSENPPRVDTSIHSVPLDEVVFDTFMGGFIPLSRATEDQIANLRDAIKPIYQPLYDPVEGGDWLSDSDLVIGLASVTGAYAYPIKILNLHEIVNDLIDGVPVLVSYCPLCVSGIVYNRQFEDQVLLFGNTSALYESDLVMYDHQTGSYWFQVIGEAIVGPLTGERLTPLPSITTTWRQWKELHPDTLVLSRDLGLFGRGTYDRDPFRGYDDAVNSGRFAFPVSEDKLDSRLLPGEKVLTLQVGESHKAYPLSQLGDAAINDAVGEKPLVVFVRAEGPSAAGYLRKVDSLELNFLLSDGKFLDKETGSIWDMGGQAISGPLAGSQLEPVPSRHSFWFSIVGSLPDIELYTP